MPQPDDIVFTQADASYMHHPYEDVLVITTEVTNSLIHRLLVDSESAVNILYWDDYQKTGLRRADPNDLSSLVIPEGTIKLAVTLGEPT